MKHVLVSRLIALTIVGVGLSFPAPARADLLFYTLPGTALTVVLQGSTSVPSGGSMIYRHPKFGNLYFDLKDVRIRKAPTTTELFSRRLNKAVSQRAADAAMDAARWALHQGLLPQFHEGVDKALEFNPQHPDAVRLAALRKRMQQPLSSWEEQERELRQMVRDPKMKIKTSAHFIMLHDTPDRPGENRKLPRAEERLELLERVYESFLLKFYSQEGGDLDIPQERLKVVLFNDHQDYLNFVNQLSPDLAKAAGFWDPKSNISVFYDQGTDETFQYLKQLAAVLRRRRDEAVKNRTFNAKDIVRNANLLLLLMEIAQENADIEVVSHEATHQMAGNTGLLPRHVRIPSWVHEGLATYFETPGDAAWSGIGAVNEDRLKWYRALESDRVHSNIDFIVGDQIFSFARTHGATLHGYGQAWALTHFLMERHFQKFMAYYRRLGQMPPDIIFSPESLNKVFDEVFGSDRRALDAEWRAYMRGLKTEIQRLTEEG